MTDYKPANDDLLSAYFDGEATGDERDEAERRLHASAPARRELAEIGEVSELVRSLPREGLPEHFAAQVLARSEREMLLAAPAATIAPIPGRRRAARWFALGSLIATAASVLVITSLIGPPSGGPDSDRAIAGRGEADHVADMETVPEVAMTPESMNGFRSARAEGSPAEPAPREVERHAAGGIGGATGPMPAAAPSEEVLGQRDAFQPRADDAPAAPRNVAGRDGANLREELGQPSPAAPRAERPAPPAAADAAPFGALPAQQPVRQNFDPRNIRPGEIVSFAEQSDEGVAVIELTVVDIHEAAGALNVLLVRNGESLERRSPASAADTRFLVPADRADAADETVDKSKHAIAEKPRARAGELLAMYVESPGNRLAAALEEMQRRGLLANPQLVASVDPRQVAVTDLEGAEAATPATSVPAAEAGASGTEDKVAITDRTTLAIAVQRHKTQSTLGRPLDRPKSEVEARGGAQNEPADEPTRSRATDGKPAVPDEPAVALQAPDTAPLPRGAPDEVETLQFFFRPEQALVAQRAAASRARQFSRDAVRELPDAVQERAQTVDGVRAPGVPLRVIFVFRQSG